MRDLVMYLTQAVLPECQDIVVEEHWRDGQYIYDVTVPEEDVGKLIGRHGRIIQSIRAVAKAVAMRQGIHVNIEVKSRSDRQEVTG